MECTKGWLEPLVARIANDRSVVAVPIIDLIETEDMSYRSWHQTFVSMIRSNLIFIWYVSDCEFWNWVPTIFEISVIWTGNRFQKESWNAQNTIQLLRFGHQRMLVAHLPSIVIFSSKSEATMRGELSFFQRKLFNFCNLLMIKISQLLKNGYLGEFWRSNWTSHAITYDFHFYIFRVAKTLN